MTDMFLPSLTLGLFYAAYIARLTRAGMLDTLNQDYVRTARAKLSISNASGNSSCFERRATACCNFSRSSICRFNKWILYHRKHFLYSWTRSFLCHRRIQSRLHHGSWNRTILCLPNHLFESVGRYYTSKHWIQNLEANEYRISKGKNLLGQNPEGSSLWGDAWIRLRANRLATASLFFFIFVSIVTILGPEMISTSYEEQDLNNAFAPPSLTHLFGTDNLGRDLLARVLHGGRISLAVGFLATAVSLLIGVSYGMASGYLGGKIDALMMRVVDILYSLPFTIFVILLMVLFGRNFILLFIAIGAVEWLTMARITRGQTLSLKQAEFIEAARALGFPDSRILIRHILPNLLGPVIVYATLTVPAVMLLEAVLSFLGLGVQAPMSSWGSLIKEGSEKMDIAPWLILFPGLFFSFTLLALNFLGDGLRDALDPKSAKD